MNSRCKGDQACEHSSKEFLQLLGLAWSRSTNSRSLKVIAQEQGLQRSCRKSTLATAILIRQSPTTSLPVTCSSSPPASRYADGDIVFSSALHAGVAQPRNTYSSGKWTRPQTCSNHSTTFLTHQSPPLSRKQGRRRAARRTRGH